MREYLIRAGIIGTTNRTNDTFGQSIRRDHRRNGTIKSALGRTSNGTGTVMAGFHVNARFMFQLISLNKQNTNQSLHRFRKSLN